RRTSTTQLRAGCSRLAPPPRRRRRRGPARPRASSRRGARRGGAQYGQDPPSRGGPGAPPAGRRRARLPARSQLPVLQSAGVEYQRADLPGPELDLALRHRDGPPLRVLVDDASLQAGTAAPERREHDIVGQDLRPRSGCEARTLSGPFDGEEVVAVALGLGEHVRLVPRAFVRVDGERDALRPTALGGRDRDLGARRLLAPWMGRAADQ